MLQIPRLAGNLLSISKITKHQRNVLKKDEAIITDGEDNIKLTAHNIGELYCLKEISNHQANVAEKENNNDTDLWHRRLGHLNKP